MLTIILPEHMSKYNNDFLTGEFAFLPASLKCNNVSEHFFLTVKSIPTKIQLFQTIQLPKLLRYRPYTVNESNIIGRNGIREVSKPSIEHDVAA